MLVLVSVAVMTMHLAAIGAASMAPLVCMWLKRQERRRGNALAGDVGLRNARRSVHALLIGSVLGGVLLLLLWQSSDSRFYAAADVVPARRWWFGGVQVLFTLVCLILYVRTWTRPFGQRVWHPLLALAASTNLLYHFPPLFAVITVLSRQRHLPANELTYRQFLTLELQSEVLARVLHFVLAATAVAGTMLLFDALRLLKRQLPGEAYRVAAWGARIALFAVALEMLSGMLLLYALPQAERARLIGGDWPTTLLLGGGVLAALGLIHVLGGIALGETSRGELMRAVTLLAVVLLLMVAARHQTRQKAISAAVANRINWLDLPSQGAWTYGTEYR